MLLRHKFKELQLDDVDTKSVVILLNAVNKHYVGVTLVLVDYWPPIYRNPTNRRSLRTYLSKSAANLKRLAGSILS